jgi:hypothetical protein
MSAILAFLGAITATSVHGPDFTEDLGMRVVARN